MGATNNAADSVFVTKVRRAIRDLPAFQNDKLPTDATTGSVLIAGSKPFRLEHQPIYKAGTASLAIPGGVTTSPVFDLAPAPAGTAPGGAPILTDAGAGGTLPAGDYIVFWTLGSGVAGGAAASLASPLSNKVTIVINHILAVSGLPNPIPAGGINVYIAPAFGTYAPVASAPGFALFIPANAVGPYQITTAPATQTVPAFINSDTGEITFGSPPGASGTLAATYQSTRFTDDQITDALYEGMNNLWPQIWNPNTDTTQISVISPIQFEYLLTAIFGDQRTIILDVEYSPPPFFQFFRTSMWRQTYDIVTPKLIFTRLPPIASIVRLTYTQTFQTLGAMPTQMQHLAKYYAIAFMLGLGETMRARADDLPANTGENPSPPGTSVQAAAWWLQQFAEQLDRFAITEPARATVMNRTVEKLGLSQFWTDAA